jgi:hypothetical protein
MKTKRSYSAVDVEKFDAKVLLPLLTTGSIVAIDVAKTKFVAGDRDRHRGSGEAREVRASTADGSLSETAVDFERGRPQAGRRDGADGDVRRCGSLSVPSAGSDGPHDAAEAYARLCGSSRWRSKHARRESGGGAREAAG